MKNIPKLLCILIVVYYVDCFPQSNKQFLKFWESFKSDLKDHNIEKVLENINIPYKIYLGGVAEVNSYDTKESLIIAYDSLFTYNEFFDLAEFDKKISYFKDGFNYEITLNKRDEEDYEFMVLFYDEEEHGGFLSYIFYFLDNKYKLLKQHIGA